MNTRVLVVSLIAVTQVGCGGAFYVEQNSIDYNTTVEQVTSNLLVTNVLRAGEGAPLFFSDLSQIRGSLQATASAQITWPFGPINKATTRDTLQTGPLSLQINPTFDIAPLNTKQFTQGILEPISLTLLRYYLMSRNVYSSIILHLFIGRIETYESGAYHDVPFESIEPTINVWVDGARPKIVTYNSPPEPLGDPVPVDPHTLIDTLAKAKTAGLDVKVTGKTIQAIKTGSHQALCVSTTSAPFQMIALAVSLDSIVTPTPEIALPPSNDVCNGKQADAAAGSRAAPSSGFRPDIVHFRSAEGMFYYLGYLASRASNPLKFQLHKESSSTDRFAVSYRRATYHVRELSDTDWTIVVLAILNDVLNVQRDANEIPSTKAVQVVP